VALLVLFPVATQAMSVGVLLRHGFEADDLGYIPTALNMCRSRTVTGLAPVSTLQSGLEMRRVFEVLLVKIFVTRLADIPANVLSGCRAGWRRMARLLAGGRGRSNQQ
jgi:hypothetical protein